MALSRQPSPRTAQEVPKHLMHDESKPLTVISGRVHLLERRIARSHADQEHNEQAIQVMAAHLDGSRAAAGHDESVS